MLCIVGEVDAKFSCFRPTHLRCHLACSNECGSQKVVSYFCFLSLEPTPNFLEIYDASTVKSSQFIVLYLQEREENVSHVSMYMREREPVSMCFTYIEYGNMQSYIFSLFFKIFFPSFFLIVFLYSKKVPCKYGTNHSSL